MSRPAGRDTAAAPVVQAAAAYAEGPRFVRRREHDTATDRNRLAAQARVEQLLDRRMEGVEVRMEDGGDDA